MGELRRRDGAPGLHGVFAAAKLSVADRAATPRQAAIRSSFATTTREPSDCSSRARSSCRRRGRRRAARVLRTPAASCDRCERRAAAVTASSVGTLGGRDRREPGVRRREGIALLARGHETHAVYSTADGAADELRRSAGSHAERLVLHRADARDPAELAPLLEAVTNDGLPLRGLVLAAAAPPLPMGLTAESAASLADYVAAATGSSRFRSVPCCRRSTTRASFSSARRRRSGPSARLAALRRRQGRDRRPRRLGRGRRARRASRRGPAAEDADRNDQLAEHATRRGRARGDRSGLVGRLEDGGLPRGLTTLGFDEQ